MQTRSCGISATNCAESRRRLRVLGSASPSLKQDPINSLGGDVGEAGIEAQEFHSELGVFDAAQIQHGGVQIVDIHRILDSGIAEFVGGAVAEAWSDGATA